MFRSLVAVVAVAGFVVAEDKKPVLKGTWTREHNGVTVDVKFPKDGKMEIIAAAGDNGVTVSCDYKLEKDGTLKAKVTGTKEMGSFPAKPADGTTFSFKFKVEGKKATLSDFEAKDLEGAKEAMEGEYESKAK